MSHGLETGAFESPDEKKKETREENEFIAKKVEEVRSKIVDDLEKTSVYYPFNYETIKSLYELRETPEGKKLIDEKQGILKQIIKAIDNEKELKYWFPSKSNDEIVSVLEELTGKSSEAEKEPTKH